MSDKTKICRKPADAVNFWRAHVALPDAFDSAEGFWIVTLNQGREMQKVFAPATRAFGDAQRFADEVFGEVFLRYAKHFVLIHYRPGISPAPTADDVQRVRALILAGREKGTALLDAIIVGQVSDEHTSGCYSFHQLANFSAPVPFEEKPKSTVTHSKYA
ncbi:MAG TPA: JAB domain-containing protein [Candidatus Limnocylindrales bacterium]|nr:JAB domain-containing protein [Candidatus Limnocylindrales bacterium]